MFSQPTDDSQVQVGPLLEDHVQTEFAHLRAHHRLGQLADGKLRVLDPVWRLFIRKDWIFLCFIYFLKIYWFLYFLGFLKLKKIRFFNKFLKILLNLRFFIKFLNIITKFFCLKIHTILKKFIHTKNEFIFFKFIFFYWFIDFLCNFYTLYGSTTRT
jgi:hypothetical protein